MTPTAPDAWSRRAVMLGAAALPLAARSAQAAADFMGAGQGRFFRFTLGAFEVTQLLAGVETLKNPHALFAADLEDEAFTTLTKAAHLPTGRARSFLIPTLVNTGKALVLIDTGRDPVGVVGALEAAGYLIEDIDIVALTHMHADHIGGLMGPNGPTFPNARIICGKMEYDAWDEAGDEAFDTNMLPLAAKIEVLSDGGDVVPGITAMEAFGHTLGHMVYRVENDGQTLLVAGDALAHHVFSFAHYEIAMAEDEDGPRAVKTRTELLKMLAETGVVLAGYHLPWPGLGFVAQSESGFTYVPHSYQLSWEEAPDEEPR